MGPGLPLQVSPQPRPPVLVRLDCTQGTQGVIANHICPAAAAAAAGAVSFPCGLAIISCVMPQGGCAVFLMLLTGSRVDLMCRQEAAGSQQPPHSAGDLAFPGVVRHPDNDLRRQSYADGQGGRS